MPTDTVIPTSSKEVLGEKIRSRTAQAGVIGLGYVGLPLCLELAREGFTVVGIDKAEDRVENIKRGKSYIGDVPAEPFAEMVRSGKIDASTDSAVLAECDTVSICVPTPLRKTKDPDMSFIVAASEQLAKYLHPGMLIILESTTYPGTTDEVILPLLEESGLKVGEDFFLCFSPERVDPGNPTYQTKNIPKVIGGMTPACTEMGALFYSQVMETVVPVSSTAVAEMVKLLENTFRMINIGLVNEMAMMCDRMGIDVWEVIDAAKTKPFGFMPFYPGPGLGGHCIPVDPFYLSWKSKQAGHEARFIELAGQINGQMPYFVTEKIALALNGQRKAVNGSHIHIAGVAYKKDVSDVRESPALDVMTLLLQRGAKLTYADSYIPQLRLDDDLVFEAGPMRELAKAADAVVILTDHTDIDYEDLVQRSKIVIDTRNCLKGMTAPNIVRL